MLVSKDEMKIRFQANQFSHIWPVLSEVCKKLSMPSVGSYKVSFTDKLP